MKTIEQWKSIAGYEGLYAVSNFGRVKSLGNNKLRKEKILKPQKEGKGYLFVRLYRNGKGKKFKVHRLVATAFIPNPKGFEQVNHKDEVKTNNCVENIEWCNAKYNNSYGTRIERVASVQRNDPARSKVVEASRFSDFREIELRFDSIMEAGRKGYHQGNVSACCRWCYCREGNNKYKGLFWRFAS